MVAPLLLFGLGAAGTYALDRAERAKAAEIADEKRRALNNAIQMSGMLGQDPSPRILGGARPGPTMNAWQGLPREQQVSGVMRHLANAGYGDEVNRFILEQRLKPKTAPNPVTINEQLVDPITGRIIRDYRTPETVEPDIREFYDSRYDGKRRAFDANSPRVQAMLLDGTLSLSAPEPAKSPVQQFQEKYGAIPQGMTPEVRNGEITGRLVPLPGSDKHPAVIESKATAELEAAKPQARRAYTMARQQMDEAIEMMDTIIKDPNTRNVVGSWEGVDGDKWYSKPIIGDKNATAYTNIISLQDLLQAIGMQAVRDASPTGGAGGQVTEREWPKFMARFGNIYRMQGEEAFLGNMEDAKEELKKLRDALSGYYKADYGESFVPWEDDAVTVGDYTIREVQ